MIRSLLMRKLLRWVNAVPVVLMLFVTYVSHLPGTSVGRIRPPMDKVLHFVAYFGLGLSICMCIRALRWQRRPWVYSALAILAVLGFGILDEWHQSFVPGRSASAGDVVADFLGGVAAMGFWRLTRAWRLTDPILFGRDS